MSSSMQGGGAYWQSTMAADPPRQYPRLNADLDTDVVIVGAGIVGLTAALALAEAGKSVVVLEALRVGAQATARSTAKVTSQHGLIYSRLAHDFGEDKARLYAQANQQAIDRIEAITTQLAVDCAFQRLPAYVYARPGEDSQALEREADIAQRLGLPASLEREIAAPVAVEAALRFGDQAQFNPVRYLHGVAASLAQQVRLFEMTRVLAVDKFAASGAATRGVLRRMCVETENSCRVSADHVIVATHLPVVSDGMFFARAYPFAHTMLAAPLEAGHGINGMAVTASAPGYSFRVDESLGRPHLIAVGPTYENGDTQGQVSSFEQLERFVNESFGVQHISHRWTNIDFRSMDGLPFAGRASAASERIYVATGFNAWGITTGTVAGQALADQIIGRLSDYIDLFETSRLKPLKGGAELVKETAQSAKHFIADRFHGSRPSPDSLERGEAVVVKTDGEHLAAYRDEDGVLHKVSAVCTHMGCIVGWNPVDRSWDCPCHGSRFDCTGAVLHGPATRRLKPV